MVGEDINVLATGHHADDHVETLIMRLLSAPVEPAEITPMRHYRRWGMTYGMKGMESWLVKPLLTAPKVRLVFRISSGTNLN